MGDEPGNKDELENLYKELIFLYSSIHRMLKRKVVIDDLLAAFEMPNEVKRADLEVALETTEISEDGVVTDAYSNSITDLDYRRLQDALSWPITLHHSMGSILGKCKQKYYEIELNLSDVFPRNGEDEGYDDKRFWSSRLNEYLRANNLAIKHPITGNPCLLLAIASRDLKGRYVLESKIDKKRSGWHKTFSDIFPLKLVPLSENATLNNTYDGCIKAVDFFKSSQEQDISGDPSSDHSKP